MVDTSAGEPIEELVDRLQQKELSRGGFIAALTGLGASATGIATLLASVESTSAATLPPRRKRAYPSEQDHNQALHQAHVQRQSGATQHDQSSASSGAAISPAQVDETRVPAAIAHNLNASQMQKLQAIADDYADDAVVEDPLFGTMIAGKEAIAQRKMAEMMSMRGATIDVTNRFAHQNQVVAEWVVRGTHEGAFLGFPGTGRQIEVRGVTVVTRERGKITKESLYYDVADVRRQLS